MAFQGTAFFERLLLGLLARRRAVLVGAALLFAALAPGALRLETDNSPPVWLLDGAPETGRYRAFVATFGADEGVRVVVEGAALWSEAGLRFLERVEREAALLPGVTDASSFVRHHRAAFEVFPPADLAAFRATVEGNALDRAMGWVVPGGADGAGGARPAASVTLATAALPPAEVAALVGVLERITAGAPAGLATTVLGTRSLELALDRSSREIGTVFLPLLLLFALLLLGLTFRDAAGVAVPLGFVLFCEGIVLGAMGWAGVKLNLVVAILPPLLFVIALATAIHVLIPVRTLEALGTRPAIAVAAVYRDKGRALFWIGVSTAAGFASLAVSAVPPVATLGRWAAFGLAATVLAAFVVYPALVAAAAARRGLPERALEERLERFGRRFAAASARRRGLVLGLYAAAAAAAALGLARLAPESDALRYLAPEHPVRAGFERLEAMGLGLQTVELHLTSPADGAGWRGAEGLAALAALTARLRERPPAGELSAAPAGILAVVSAADFADDAGAASPFAGLASAEEDRATGLALLEADPDGARLVERFLSADGREARLTLFVRAAGFEVIDPLAESAEAIARELAPPGTEVEATGVLRGLLAIHRSLLTTLAASLALTLPILAAVFAWLLRRPKDVLRALVPNVTPILILLGGMGWLGIGLDVATVMVASIVLGLVVDDTIHTLARYREKKLELGAFEAVAERLEHTAPAYLLTGAILAAGFGVCALSDFEPIARFGALSATTVTLAVLADLTLVPALFARE